MTESEALELFKERLTLIKEHYAGEVKDYEEALEIGIQALEKQIPKKPISYDDCEQFVIRCTCGKCTDTRFFHGYCTWCGQKLDWSDED